MLPLFARVDDDELPSGWVIDRDGVARPFWYSYTGYIVKWSIFLGILTLISLYLLVGHIHARRRLKQGKLPLRYHRFMVSRAAMAKVDPRYADPIPIYQTYNQPPPAYYVVMQPVAPPPPTYRPSEAKPEYSGDFAAPPFAGPSSVDHQQPQQTSGVTTDYPPPPPGPATSTVR
ncbi:hypothetical protein Cpir12675_004841 [Ceratocystis pirilliformis]|uniref:Uncharacterized protein n=1 Tax=Ceratocystis pirilliformis TaxID=259994 RepID=A0ABR3YU34_9PEZI